MDVAANVEIVAEEEAVEELQDLYALLEREDIQPNIEEELAIQPQVQTIQNHSKPSSNRKKLKLLHRKLKTKYNRSNLNRKRQRYTELVRIVM